MSNTDTLTNQARWARFRFSVIGPLLSAPPQEGQLQTELRELAGKTWTHPITALPVNFGASTIERWYYLAKQELDPVRALRTKQRQDSGSSRSLSVAVKNALKEQYQAHQSWSYQLHADNLTALCKQHQGWVLLLPTAP